MSVLDCLGAKLEALVVKRSSLLSKGEQGPISKKRIQELDDAISVFKSNTAEATDLIEQLKGKYGGDTVEAARQAAEEALSILQDRYSYRSQNILKARNLAKQDAEAIMESIKGGSKIKSIIKAIYYGGYTPGEPIPRASFGRLSFDESKKANIQLLEAGLSKALDTESTSLTKLMASDTWHDDIGRAWFDHAHGTKTPGVNPEGLKVAPLIQEQSMGWAQRLNNAGIYVKASTSHLAGLELTPRAVMKMERSEFVALIKQHLNWSKTSEAIDMPGLSTSQQMQEIFASHVYDHFVTGGAVRIGDWAPIRKMGMSSVANARGHQRILIVKDFDSWKAIQSKVGTTDRFMEHVYSQATKVGSDLAGADSFSASPGMYLGNLMRELETHNNLTAAEAHKALTKFMEADFAPNSHWKDVPEFAKATIGTLANQSRASLLGNVGVQSLQETIATAAVKHAHGLPVMKIFFKTLVEVLNPKLTEHRTIAARLGKEAYALIDAFRASPRDSSLALMERYGAWGTQATMKYTLGTRIQVAHRQIAVAETENILLDWAAGKVPSNRFKSYQDHFFLNESDKSLMKEFSVPESDGSLSKKLDLEAMYSSKRPEAENLARRLATGFQSVQQIVAPDHSPVLDHFFKSMESAGISGAIASKSFKTFTGFMGGTFFYQLKPLLSMKGAPKFAYLASYVMANTMMSAMYIQLMRIANGKDTLPIGPELMARSVMALPFGMVGKLLLSGGSDKFNITDMSAISNALGIHARLPIHIIQDLYNGKRPDRIGKDLADIMRFWTPGSTAWPIRATLNHYVYNPVEHFFDREAASKRWREEASRESSKNKSGIYWPADQLTPSRSPDISKAFTIKGQ